MPNGGILPAAVRGALVTRKKLCIVVLLLFGLVSALCVNYSYYYRYYKSLDPLVIEKWESIQSSRDFGKVIPAYLTMRLFWMDKTVAGVKSGEPVNFQDHEMSLYYYGAILARVFGMMKGWQVFLFIQMAAASLALLLYPLLVYKISLSLACAFASPFFFHYFFGRVLYIDKTDTYWAYAWVVVFALPVFTLFAKRKWDLKKWLLLLILASVAAVGSVVRSHAGLPVLAALVLSLARECFVAVREKKSGKLFSRAAAVMVLFLAGFLCSSVIPAAFFQKYGYRDLDFPPWHTLYIGLGYGPNPYGIKYVDAVGEQHAKRIDPATYYSRDGVSPDSYFEILKGEYFRIMKENPAFFFSVYTKKALGAVKADIFHLLSLPFRTFFLFAVLAVFLLYRFIAQKPILSLLRPLSPFFFAALVCAVVGIIPGLAAIPLPFYLYGSMYALSAAAFCLALSALKGLAAVSGRLVSRAKENAAEERSYLSAAGEEDAPVRGRPVIAIVVPCFNEEETLPETAEQLSGKIKRLVSDGIVSEKSSLLFVDDGSSDNTWNLVKKYHAENPALVRGIKLAANRGHQNALLAGLLEAKELAGAVISIDADLQDDIDAMDAMIEKYRRGAEIVYGVRADRQSDSFFKRTSARAFYRLMRFLGAEIVYDHADFRLMGKASLDALAEYGEVNLFLRGIVPALGYKTGAVYYDRKERRAGTGKYPLGKMLQFAFEGISSFSIKPIRLISVLGASIFAASLGMIIYFFARYFSGDTVTGWASIACSIWGIGGLILLSVGVVGEYIGKIYLEAKRRPRYRIAERLAGEDGTEP